MTAQKRIYVVTDNGNGTLTRLVKASSQAQAIHHVVAQRYRAEVASQSQLVQLLTNNVKVEETGNE